MLCVCLFSNISKAGLYTPPISGGRGSTLHPAVCQGPGGGANPAVLVKPSLGAKKYILKAFLEILRHADKPNFGFTEKTVTCMNNFDLSHKLRFIRSS